MCVRVVQAWGIDLTRFRFDCGQSWAAFILNARDGTVYARYGTRASRDASEFNDIEGFKKTLKAALELHEDYPGCKSSLEGKKSPDTRWRYPESLPENQGQYRHLTSDRKGCLCCHCVQSGEILTKRKLGLPLHDDQLWVYPPPDLLGIHMDPRETALVAGIDPESEGKKAGLEAGDRIVSMEGQPMLSIADIQWVLHKAKDGSAVKLCVDRAGGNKSLALKLPRGWRRRMEFSWRPSTWPLRQRILGMVLVEVPDKEKDGIGVERDALAFRIQKITPDWVKKRNPDAKRVGLKEGDVIVGVDGKTAAMTESQLLAYVIQEKAPGGKVLLSVLRGDSRLKFQLTVR